jgi:ABC-type transporter Mla subunit MlaD
MARRLVPSVLAVALVVLAVVVIAPGGESGHRFTVTVAEATNVVSGQAIRQAGAKVGQVVAIHPADHGHAAKLELELSDAAWPVPAGTKMELRWGGTANFSNRYIAVHPGHGTGSAVDAGGQFPAADFQVPVESDQMLAMFNRPARARLRRFFLEVGPAMKASRPGLRQTLRRGPAALDEASAVLGDLDADEVALRTLVRSGDDVVSAVDDAQPGLRDLLQGAAGTFDAIADESRSVEASLLQAPETLRSARVTLARADPTLDQARDVAVRVRPGVTELRRIARPLNDLLRGVRASGPDAVATLATTRRAVPDINALLDRVGGLAPQVGDAGRQSVAAMKCIRPFTPDIVAWFTNWGDFLSLTDGKDRILRAQVQSLTYTPGNNVPWGTDTEAKLASNMEYGFPRPPGTDAGQPWFLPACGAGPDALDPTKDPEIRPGSQVFDMPKLRAIVPAPAETSP